MAFRRSRGTNLRQLRESEAFRATFANFLRRRPDEWRKRRVDHFTPTELYAAERRITLHGEIGVDLMAAFAEAESRLLSQRALSELQTGTSLPLYIPFAAFTKHPWLRFSSHNASGEAVPVLTRFDGSTITGWYLLQVLESVARRRESPPANVFAGAALAASSLAAINPTALEKRLASWSRNWGSYQDDSRILMWVEREAEAFRPRLGTQLLRLLDDTTLIANGQSLPELAGSRNDEPLAVRTVAGLILLGIRDVLKLIVAWEPFGRRPSLFDPRDRTLLDRFSRIVLPGLEYFDQLVAEACAASEGRQGATQELADAINYWTAYLAVDVPLGRPFLYKTEEILVFPHRGKLDRMWTQHNYRVELRDAVATHVEVMSGDAELEIAHWFATGVRAAELGNAKPGRSRPVSEFFGTQHQTSRDLRHYYTTRRPGESVGVADHRLRLVIRYRVAPSVRRGYYFLTLGLLLAAAWVAYEWIEPALHGKGPPNEDEIVLVSATLVVLPLWFTSMQHKKQVVHQKLRIFRTLMYCAFVALIGAPGVSFGWRLFT